MIWKTIESADETSEIRIGWNGDWVFLFAWFYVKRRIDAGENCWVMCSGYGDGEPHIMYVGDEPGSEAWWVEPTHWCEFPEPPR